MTRALAILLLIGVSLPARTQQPFAAAPDAEEVNVNARYTVEDVEISGASESHISKGLREDLHRLVGAKLNPEILDDLARRMRSELQARSVYRRVVKGATPEHVRVVFDVANRKVAFDLSVPRFVYQTAQGWSAGVEGSLTSAQNKFALAVVSDGDQSTERFAGLQARYENSRIGSDRVRMQLQFASFHDQWNQATVDALATGHSSETPDIYRARQQFQPTFAFVLAKPLTLSVGADFQRLDAELPAARTQASNAAIMTLRYLRRMEGSGEYQQDVEGGYSLRAATQTLGSDYVYIRHRWDFTYALTRGKHILTDRVLAGLITGRAPFYERYVLGTGSLLRGWNKYDLDPLGGDRVVYNSVEYRYGLAEVFYDSGAVWSRGEAPVARHSLGVGIRKGVFLVAMAFPLTDGRVTPVFLVGMNY